VYTKNTIMEQKMTEKEFYAGWKDSELDPDVGRAAFNSFEASGSTYADFEAEQVGYLAAKTLKDSEAAIQKATIKLQQTVGWNEMTEENKALAIEETTLIALGLPATQVGMHRQSNMMVNGFIKNKVKGYEIPEDDKSTEEINEEEDGRQYLQAQAWAKIQLETMRKASGGMDYEQMRATFVNGQMGMMYVNIQKGDQDTNTQINNIQLPLGQTSESRLYGQEYLENQAKNLYSGPENKQTLAKILDDLRDSKYSLFGRGEGTKKLEEGPAYDLVKKAQIDYFINQQSKLLGKTSYMYIEMLKEQDSNKDL